MGRNEYRPYSCHQLAVVIAVAQSQTSQTLQALMQITQTLQTKIMQTSQIMNQEHPEALEDLIV